MSDKLFKIYKSSAGSGKTYTLVKEYLKLAFANPTYYRCILAVTFTNKATSEMKTRVIQSLYDFVRGKDNPMATELKSSLSLDDVTFQKKSQEVLYSILHGYAHFSVSTIDTFFQKIIYSFAKEAGLYGGFKLELEQEQILGQVVDQMVDEIEEKDELTRWLVRFAQEKVDAGKLWDVKRDIKNLGRELFRETLKEVSSELYEYAKDKKQFADFQSQLKTILRTFEKEMAAIGNQALEAISQTGLEVTDFSYGKGGVAGYFFKIASGNIVDPNKRVMDSLDNTEAWYAKKSPHKEIIENLVSQRLIVLLHQAIDYYDQYFNKYQSASEVNKQLYSFTVLSDVAKKLEQFKSQEGMMLISDSGKFLRQIIDNNDTPFIYEKVGSFFEHYLIDEFQDTSGFQWENFRPLIENGLSQGSMSMVVGDAKQSIYRWRDGDPMILQSTVQRQIGDPYTCEINLDTNYRSAENIVTFNNLIFKYFAQKIKPMLEVEEGSEKYNTYLADKVQKIAKVYEDVVQSMPESEQSAKYKGFLQFSFIDNSKKKGVEWKEEILSQIPKWLEKLQDQGVKIEQIGILVRKASEARLVMEAVMAYQQEGKGKEAYRYDLISNESLQVGSATVVQVLLNIFRYLQNSADKVAQANIVYAYQCSVLGRSKKDLHQLLSTDNPSSYLPVEFVHQVESLKKKPLYELTEILFRLFGLQKFSQEMAYWQSFQDVVLEFSSTKTNNLQIFLEWWEENGYKQKVQLPSTVKAAQVLTVHKSKGLQFKAVILPFITWTIDHEPSQTNIIWTKSDISPYDQLPILPLKYGKALPNTVFAKAYYEEKMNVYLDNLNLLYVAFTRAEEYLIGYSTTPGKTVKKIGDILYHLFDAKEIFPEGWSQSGTFVYGTLKPAETPVIDSEEKLLPIYVSHDWNEKLKINYQATSFFSSEGERMKGVNFGNLLHELMSRVATLDQLPKALQAMHCEGTIDIEQMNRLEAVTKKIENHPIVSTWFDAHWKVKMEVSILQTSGEVNRPDRVMIDGKKAVVVDYKTGKHDLKHTGQAATYKQLLSEMGFEKISAYLLYVDQMEVVEV